MTILRQQLATLSQPNVTNVTVSQLSEILKNTKTIKGMANFATVLQLTQPKTLKKDRNTLEPFSDTIEKLSRVSIILNTEYVTGVENQLKRENKETTDYKKGQNTMPLVKFENNNFFGTFYNKPVIEYRPNTNPNNIPEVQYFLNGNQVSKKELPNVLPIRKKATNQNTEKEIFWRKLYVKNIVEITVNNKTYRVTT